MKQSVALPKEEERKKKAIKMTDMTMTTEMMRRMVRAGVATWTVRPLLGSRKPSTDPSYWM